MKNSVLLVLFLSIFVLVGFVGSNGNQSQPESKYILLADVTNGTDGTYEYYVDMQTLKNLGIQLDLDGGSGTITATVEASLQDDGTAQASVAYVDVTEAVFGSATFTADAMLLDDTGALAMARYVKVKIITDTTGANDADWTIFARAVQ